MENKINLKLDIFYIIILVIFLIGLPFILFSYNNSFLNSEGLNNSKMFILVGRSDHGWMLGNISAYDILPLWFQDKTNNNIQIKVNKGDRVLLKLNSSDVIHGFSLKEFGIFIDNGITPGKPIFVSFIANTVGTFPFSCNIICGDNHEDMKGTIVVTG